MVAAYVLAAVLGLVIGSFLNVVIWRVPRGESIVHPPSACPSCGHPVRRRDNVPVVSWLLLRGRCRDCSEPISWRYPTVELGTALAFVGVLAVVGVTWALPAYLYLAAIGIALFLIDIDVKRLPNAIVYPAYLVLPVLLTLASLNPGGVSDWGALWRALLAGGALLAFYVLIRLAYPPGMALGDVKLSGVLGMAMGWVGWGSLAVGGFAGFLLGGVVSVALLAAGRATRKSAVPFGPFMIVGAFVGIVVGESVWGAYLGVF